MLRGIERWWRSRGHGVHSPMAYRLLTRVLTDSQAEYYAMGERLDGLCRSRREKRRVRRIYRFKVAVNASETRIHGELSEAESAALEQEGTGITGRLLEVNREGKRLYLRVWATGERGGPLVLEGRHETYEIALKEAPRRRILFRER